MGTLVFAPSLTKVGLGVTLHIPKLGFLRQLRFAPRLDSASWCGKLCGILLVLLVLACLWFPIIRPATNIVHSHTLSSGSTPNPEIGLLVASLRYLATLFTWDSPFQSISFSGQHLKYILNLIWNTGTHLFTTSSPFISKLYKSRFSTCNVYFRDLGLTGCARRSERPIKLAISHYIDLRLTSFSRVQTVAFSCGVSPSGGNAR